VCILEVQKGMVKGKMSRIDQDTKQNRGGSFFEIHPPRTIAAEEKIKLDVSPSAMRTSILANPARTAA